MSCSRHSCAIVFGPRSDASTSSVFCCALNFRYLRDSPTGSSFGGSGRPCCEARRTDRRSASPYGLSSATTRPVV